MTEKYIDLAHPILAEADNSNTTSFCLGVRNALYWLDEHPDQAPGRTITASEFDEAVESCVTEDATVPPHTFAARLGVVCVPDPEPTNAEKLEADLVDWYAKNDDARPSLADHLIERGWTKAPGGDDD